MYQVILLLCLLISSEAFTASSTSRTKIIIPSQLNLFGGGNKGDGEAKKPGMMDQLAMFKKAQEMAQKKQKLDAELQKMDFQGIAEGKVNVAIKFVPVSNPMDPNPDYEATSFDFDETWFDSASPEEISEAVKAALQDGIDKTNVAVAQKYSILQEDLMAALGGASGLK